jgi:hypothetical protein
VKSKQGVDGDLEEKIPGRRSPIKAWDNTVNQSMSQLFVVFCEVIATHADRESGALLDLCTQDQSMMREERKKLTVLTMKTSCTVHRR